MTSHNALTNELTNYELSPAGSELVRKFVKHVTAYPQASPATSLVRNFVVKEGER